jgi:hypothetical protein
MGFKMELRGPLIEKEHAYFLWYDLLWHARFSEDPKILAAVKKGEKFYASWGDDYELPDDWWEDHRHLFEEQYVVRRLSPGERPTDPEALVVEIPLTKSPTQLTKDVRKIIQAASAERNKKTTKGKKRPSARYKLSYGSKPKLDALADILNVYSIYLVNESLRGEKLLKAIRAGFRKKSARGLAKLPSALEYRPDDLDDKARALRNMRRYIQKAEKVILNVANGAFPGKY